MKPTHPLCCKKCQSQNLNFRPGTGQHALRADCLDCKAWYWVGKSIAIPLLESGRIKLQSLQGNQLSLFGTVD